MASSVSAPVVVPQSTKRTHAEMSSCEIPTQQNLSSLQSGEVSSSTSPAPGVKTADSKVLLESKDTGNTVSKLPGIDPVLANSHASHDLHLKENTAGLSSMTTSPEMNETLKQSQTLMCDAPDIANEAQKTASKLTGGSESVDIEMSLNGHSAVTTLDIKETKKLTDEASHVLNKNISTQLISETSVSGGPANSPVELVTGNHDPTARPSTEPTTLQSVTVASKNSTSTKSNSSKPQLEDGEEPEKKAKIVASTSKAGGRTPEQILEYMDKTFEQRRKIITKQMPSIPELKELYPDLFTGKQLLIEFQRITKIDIDQKIQEFCVRYATAVIEMAKNKKGAAPVLARWEQAKQENDTLRQYWDMVTALCLLPLHFGENFVEMVLEIGEDEEVVAQGKIVPTLIARGNIFRTDEFFLIAENTIVQEFEEFTIAFASLYSSYWVFNMVYPETIENTYNYIQRCIVRQREPGSIPAECKNFTKALLKWNKGKEGK